MERVMQRIRNRVTGGGGLIHNYGLIAIAAVLILIIVVIVAVIISLNSSAMTRGHPESDRVECPGLDDEECERKKCLFHAVEYGPSCYMKKNSFGYNVTNITKEADGILVQMTPLSNDTPYGKSFKNVNVKFTYLTENIFRFQFKDADNERYEVPVQNDFPLLQNLPELNTANLFYEIQHTREKEVFQFVVYRKNHTDQFIWDTRIGALLLSNQYLQIGSYLPSDNIYGLGEHVHDSLKHDMLFRSWPMFARDRAAASPSEGTNLYGVHPFYTCLEKSGASHGVLFLNSNAMEATLLPAPAITFRTIGGILDFFVFVGDDPEHVIQLYTSLIGRPMLPPYWSLGFQLSKYGYGWISRLEAVLNRTRAAGIPLAVQYLDIDHMEDQRDFTIDNYSFPGLSAYMDLQREEHGLKWVIILDPAIAADEDYEPYSTGLSSQSYIKRAPFWNEAMFPPFVQKNNVTYGKVWPTNYVAFADFFVEEAKQWWKDSILKHYEVMKFDGLWIDMNEPANFETNVKNPDYCRQGDAECWALKCPHSRYEDPPYNPLKKTGSGRLSEKTLCMESVQGGSNTSDTEYLHYNVHSLYGWSQTQPTLEAAQEATGTRSLVFSRSTYPSSGRYGGHWLGDNFSTFESLQSSIIGILEFNLFGIPYVGADVCGFVGTATSELCKRWMQVGAFYPFFRNHNGQGYDDQDPASFGDAVITASRKAIVRRIILNPYLYTLFYRAHVDGNTVVRPMFHEYPTDELTWNMGNQFMWGKSLMITPILTEGRKTVILYLPKGEWWHFHDNQTYQQPRTGRFVIEADAEEYAPLHVRGGTILPVGIYDPENYPESENATTRDISLYVFNEGGISSGELFMDDGISNGTVKSEAYALYTFEAENCTMTITSDEKSSFNGPKPHLNQVFVFKVMSAAANQSGYSLTMDNKRQMATINVDAEMSTVTKLTWLDGGECAMKP